MQYIQLLLTDKEHNAMNNTAIYPKSNFTKSSSTLNSQSQERLAPLSLVGSKISGSGTKSPKPAISLQKPNMTFTLKAPVTTINSPSQMMKPPDITLATPSIQLNQHNKEIQNKLRTNYDFDMSSDSSSEPEGFIKNHELRLLFKMIIILNNKVFNLNSYFVILQSKLITK